MERDATISPARLAISAPVAAAPNSTRAALSAARPGAPTKRPAPNVMAESMPDVTVALVLACDTAVSMKPLSASNAATFCSFGARLRVDNSLPIIPINSDPASIGHSPENPPANPPTRAPTGIEAPPVTGAATAPRAAPPFAPAIIPAMDGAILAICEAVRYAKPFGLVTACLPTFHNICPTAPTLSSGSLQSPAATLACCAGANDSATSLNSCGLPD